MIVCAPSLQVNDETFIQLCQSNPDLRLERNAVGELLVMPPSGSQSGYFNSDITGQLWLWNRREKRGYVFDSSAGFTLPNGAIRSPDASWIAKQRWENLTLEQRRKFAPICPDLVIELKSPGDDIAFLQDKMREYINNGTQLGWLIDPDAKLVYIYCPSVDVLQLDRPSTICGEPVCPNLVIDLTSIWN